MDIQTNLKEVVAELPGNVRLVAVSKFHPAEAIEAAYAAGQRIFGESKEQELSGKYEKLPKDIEWHFIGHLQTNKVKYIAPYIAMIHAADSYNYWLKSTNKLPSTTASSPACSRYISHRKKANTDLHSTLAGRCFVRENGKT